MEKINGAGGDGMEDAKPSIDKGMMIDEESKEEEEEESKEDGKK